VEEAVHVHEEKVEIFEIEKNANVQQYSQYHLRFFQSPALGFAHELCKPIVHHDRNQNDCQITGIEIAVEPQRHTQEKTLRQGIASQMVQPEVADEAKGKENQNENVRIKKQAASLLKKSIIPHYNGYYRGLGGKCQERGESWWLRMVKDRVCIRCQKNSPTPKGVGLFAVGEDGFVADPSYGRIVRSRCGTARIPSSATKNRYPFG
jgi:hypothetical protein